MLSLLAKRHLSLARVLYSRITRVPLPALSPTMENGNIVSWDKKEGDQLSEGDLLAEIETDKATMAFETPEEGYLAKILIPAGTKGVPLGKPLCIIVESEEDVAKFKNFSLEQAIEAAGGNASSVSETSSAPPPPQHQSQPFASHASTTSSSPSPSQPQLIAHPTSQTSAQQHLSSPQRTFASPLAKKLARDSGIQLPVAGSGPQGRIVGEDIRKVAASDLSQPIRASHEAPAPPAPDAEYIDLPLTNMRQTIAKRLTMSKATIPHYYLTVNLNVDELLQLRLNVNKMLAKDGIKLSLNDYIVKAAALSCKKVRQVNSSWQETFIRQYNRVDVCVAVATDNGLITPIVFDASAKGIQDIGVEIRNLAERARQGKLQPHEFQGGTFTISNLGMFDISHFTAVINPPQVAILAVGSTQQTLVQQVDSDDQPTGSKVVNTLNVTLSCDHRVVDGACGAVWLQWFRKYIEKPINMLL